MKFLFKTPESEVLELGLVYKAGYSVKNKILRDKLLKEQKGFCAYTEEYLLENTFCPEVEHFNSDKKGNDNYYNYYVVSRFANQRKMRIDQKGDYKRALFFQDLFFQNQETFESKIEYKEGIYKTVEENDLVAKQFIEYMGFNDEIISRKRINAIRRLKNTIGGFTPEEQIEYLKTEDMDILSFPTAIEYELNIDLSQIINR